LPAPDRERRDTSLLRVVAGTATDPERALAVETLAVWAPLIRTAKEAARRPRCDFGLEWEKAPRMTMPPWSAQRRAVRLLAAAAVLASGPGDREATFEALAAAGRLLSHFDDS